MDRLEAMRLFTRIVELGSFRRAAEQLDLTRTSATLVVKQLETRLGVRLLQRTTRHVHPTAEGAAYYERCVAILADVEDAEAAVVQDARSPQGRIRVDLAGSLCRLVLIPALPAFCRRYPLLTLDISVNNRQIDLVREGVDCVLRIGELRDSALLFRPLGHIEQVSCASAGYLARHGAPATLDDLEGHQAVDYISTSTGRPASLEFVIDNQVVERRLPAVVAVNNGDAYVAACEAGFGIIQAPAYQVRDQLASGLLVEILPGHRPPALPLTVLYPHGRQLPPRLRVFIDWLLELFLPVSPQAPRGT